MTGLAHLYRSQQIFGVYFSLSAVSFRYYLSFHPTILCHVTSAICTAT